MPFSVYVIAWLLLGFLAGSIPFGWLAARLHGINLREIGSGNIGATNVVRALGWGWGLTVFALDVLKGLLPLIGLRVCLAAAAPGYAPPAAGPWLLMGTGLATPSPRGSASGVARAEPPARAWCWPSCSGGRWPRWAPSC